MPPKKKKVTGLIKLQIQAGAANPAPPVGPALGQHGVNIMAFCKDFNSRTASQGDMIIPVVITVFSDRSFTFVLKTPPASVLLKKAAGLATTKKPTEAQIRTAMNGHLCRCGTYPRILTAIQKAAAVMAKGGK